MDDTPLSSDEFLRMFANVSQDQLPFVYWQPISAQRLMLILAYSLLFTAGIAGNLWVTFVIARVLGQPTGGSPAVHQETPEDVKLFILLLCCCDVVVLALRLFLLCDLFYGQWAFPSSLFSCRLYLVGECLNKFVVPVVLVGLAAYCFISIRAGKHSLPVDGTEHYGWRDRLAKRFRRRLVTLTAMAGLVPLALSALPVYYFADITYVVVHNGSDVYSVIPKCGLRPPNDIVIAFTVLSFIVAYVLPSALFTFFYFSILLYVKRHAFRWHSCSGSFYFWRVAKVTMGLVAFYLCCWTPFWFVTLWYALVPAETSGVASNGFIVTLYFVHMLPYINCTGYPFIYTILNRHIKEAYDRATSLRQQRRRSQNQLLAKRLSSLESTLSYRPWRSCKFSLASSNGKQELCTMLSTTSAGTVASVSAKPNHVSSYTML